MTPLRAQMIRELELQRKPDNTIKPYVSAVEQLAGYYHRSPDRIVGPGTTVDGPAIIAEATATTFIRRSNWKKPSGTLISGAIRICASILLNPARPAMGRAFFGRGS